VSVKVFHADHGLVSEHFTAIEKAVEGIQGFFIKVISLDGLPPLESALYGPSVGDEPVVDVELIVRNNRPGPSRMIRRPMKSATGLVAIGMVNEEGILLFTAYGNTHGVVAPREPWDKGLSEEEKNKSEEFWAVHALALG
jgi:hypothetical protein